MKRLLFQVSLAVSVAIAMGTAPVALGQSDPSSSQNRGGSPFEVPVGSEGNTISLALDKPSDMALESVDVTVEEAPPWVQLTSQKAIAQLAPDAVAHATFQFEVDGAVALGTVGTIRVAVRDGNSVVGRTDIAVRASSPIAFDVAHAYPNPFSTRSKIPLLLPRHADVKADVYDVLGRRVAVLADGAYDAGRHDLEIEAGGMAAGAYVVRVSIDDGARIVNRRITVVR